MRGVNHRPAFVACSLLLGAILAGGSSVAQQREDSLDTARARYAAAAYEEALAILDAAKPADSDMDLHVEIEKYRTLCLLALGRKADAERSIERLVTLKPSLVGDQLEASPWVRETFHAVRRRVLPGVVGERYEQAKAAVMQKSFREAAGRLKEVMVLLDDRDLAATDERWRRDLRTLAQGFLDLAETAGSSSPLPSTRVSTEPAPAAAVEDAAIVPAAPIAEQAPPWPRDLRNFMAERATATGVIEVTVDEKGAVDNAVMREPIHPVYDALLLAAARSTWRYRPATKGGVAVRDTRRIRIVVNLR